MEIGNFKIKGNISDNHFSVSTIETKGLNEIHFWRKSENNTLIIEEGCSFNKLKIVFKGNNNKLIIGANVRWTGHILVVGNNRLVTIGEGTTAQGVYILSRDEDVIIGKNCMFSREIEIRSTDVHKIYDLDTGERINPAKKVIIGDNVWIGARVIVSKGANIPNGCVIGASSFVNKKFETCNVIIAGTPAKVVKNNIIWER
ncbi:acyltransferase [Ignatzschineria sp. RMDPL8A]|uniref:acyltransferase n=1 Tax=Ignatzschineria sp. RMDPL8A TaxID=2999236 RepID=UPI0024466CA9|nr:acyltransferase [Ignatzschineria sp. RMDPL8A]MDG9730413.1 acyltransferase [Ignatzschineria sp. RMDPL8A]